MKWLTQGRSWARGKNRTIVHDLTPQRTTFTQTE